MIVYDRGGSLNLMVEASLGASSGRGATLVGCSKVFVAFKSGPVRVSQLSKRLGSKSLNSSSSSRSDSRSRLSVKTGHVSGPKGLKKLSGNIVL